MADNKKIDLSDLGAKPVDLSDLGATPVEQPELASVETTPQVSQLEAAGRAAAQGLSLSTSDEIAAGVQSLGELPKTGLNWEALKKVYEEKVLKQRERENLAKEQHPVTYHTAEIAAPLLLPVAGALGAAGKLGAVGGAIAEGTQFLNVPGKVISGTGAALEALPGATKLAQSFPGISRIAKGAVEGATVGGLYGAGKTEAPITSDEGLEQIKESAKFGGIIGGGLSSLGVGAQKLAEHGESYSGPIGDMSKGYLAALEGKNLKDFNKVADQAYEYSQVTGNRWLTDEVQRIKNAFNSLEASGEASGQKANVQDIFDSLQRMKTQAENVSDPDAQKTIKKLIGLFENKTYGLKPAMVTEQKPAELGMRDVVSLEKKIGEDKLSQSLEPAQKKVYNEVDKLISGKAEEINPEYAVPRSEWKNMENAFEKIGVDRNEMVDFLSKGPEASPDFMKKVNDQIIKSFEPDYAGKVAKENLDRAFGFLEEAGYKDLPQIRQQLEENMKDYLLSQQMSFGGVHPGVASHNPKVATLGALKSFGVGGAHRVGLIQGKPLTQSLSSTTPGVIGKELAQQRELSTPTENLSRDLSYSDNANLQGITQTLKADPSLSYYGDALEKAIQSGDTVKKNALIFAISQNPNARKLLEGQK